MPRVEIDFHRIRAVRGDRRSGFEELCAQLAYLEDRAKDSIYFRKGVGADAGVECFVRNPDGSEHGWQAKYFFEFGQTQGGQLDDSIEQALNKHPQLVRFIVCIPFNLRDARQGQKKSQLRRWDEWREKWLAWAKKSKRKLAIDLWDETAISVRLQRDSAQHEGRRDYWFDETLLSPKWFAERFEQARAGLGARYTPETNVELPIRRSLLGFCRDPYVIAEIEKWSEKLEEASHKLVGSLRKINPPVNEGLISTIEARTTALLRALNSTSYEPSASIPIEHYKALAKEAQEATWACARAFGPSRPEKRRHQGTKLSITQRTNFAHWNGHWINSTTNPSMSTGGL
jgi:hypothetical protein